MKINQGNTGFDLLKKESENHKMSQNHLALFERKLDNQPKFKKKVNWFSVPMAAVLVVGLILTGIFTFSNTNGNSDLDEYHTTKSYFASYIEFEIGKQKEKINAHNITIIQSSLNEVNRLQSDYLKIENEFLTQHYDKQILKRMIDNFRQQLDILENIDLILEETRSNQPKSLPKHENEII